MIEVKDAPKLKGLSFRRLKDKSDYAVMSAISQKSWLADGFEWIQTEEDIASSYRGDDWRDPVEDLLFAEANGEAIGYGEITTERIDEKSFFFWNSVHLMPEWRGRGIREAIFDFNEAELIKRSRSTDTSSFFQTWANDAPNDWKSIVLARSYRPCWHVLEMVRPSLDEIPIHDLPKGLEVKTITPSGYRQVWEGMREAYRDEPWFTESKFSDMRYREWIESPDFSSKLWQVAWDGDKIVGIVQNFVKNEENEAFGRRRGHTERIFVAPKWQRKGVARALISRSLRLLREIGMQDATLDVVAENASGALRLYESMGYKATYHFTFYRKPIPR